MIFDGTKKSIFFGLGLTRAGKVMIILGNVFDDNPFIDFISAALPWVLLGLMVLFAILYLNKENDN